MNTRIVWVDNVRVIACFLVVLLHVSAYHLYQIKDISSLSWNTANIIQSLTRVCVPLFFMISGFAFMQNKNVQNKNVYKIILNLAFYTLIYFTYVYFFRDSVISKLSLSDALSSIIHRPIFFHLWFFYQILICYVFFTFISVKNVSSNKTLASITVIFIVFNAKTTYFTSMLFGFDWYGVITINDDLPFYITYAALGAVLGREEIYMHRKYMYISGFIALSLLTAYLTYLSSLERGKLSQSFYFYSSFIVMFSSVLLFKYIRCIDRAILGKYTLIISGVSLPVYGFHPLILELFITNGLRMSNVVGDTVLFTFIALGISAAIGLAIKKIDVKNILS